MATIVFVFTIIAIFTFKYFLCTSIFVVSYNVIYSLYEAKIGKVALETLQKNGCLDGMPRSEQMDMFDLLG